MLHNGRSSLNVSFFVNIEYILLTSCGKVSGSVFKMYVLPVHIHVCAILLGAKGADHEFMKKRFSQVKENEIVAPAELVKMVRRDLFRQSTEMNISWENGGKIYQYAAETFFFSNGQSGNAFTVTGDYGSMVNYMGSGFKMMSHGKVNIRSLPPINHPVWVTFIVSDEEGEISN